MSIVRQQDDDSKSLRISKLKLELESYKEVVIRSQEAVFGEQAIYNQKMQDIWKKSVDFIDGANNFHDTKGISSPWWNAQILKIQNPVIYQESSTRRQRKIDLERLVLEIKKIQMVVGSKEREAIKLRSKTTFETARILGLKKIEHELHQEPFGFEFTSLKAQVEYSKQTCLQLGTQLNRSAESTFLRFQPKEPRLRDFMNSKLKTKGDNVEEMTTKTSKYLKIRERTSLIYRSEPSSSFNIFNGGKENSENEIFPYRDENLDGQDSEITHS